MDLRQPRWRRPFCEALNVLTTVGRPVHFELHRRFGNEIEKRNLRQQYEVAFRRYHVAGVTLAGAGVAALEHAWRITRRISSGTSHLLAARPNA